MGQTGIPQVGIDLVKRWEGLHKLGSDGLYHPYLCPANVWTIGYGSTRGFDGSPIRKDTKAVTAEEAEQLMLKELRTCVTAALRYSPVLISYEEALGAIASFIFNLGASSYYRSTLRRRINEEDWESAKSEIRKWIWGGGKQLPGLILRRNAEASYL